MPPQFFPPVLSYQIVSRTHSSEVEWEGLDDSMDLFSLGTSTEFQPNA